MYSLVALGLTLVYGILHVPNFAHGAFYMAVGVLPLAEDARPDAKSFTERFRKLTPGKDPSSEISLNYSAVHATMLAMKLAGTVSDPAAIRAQMDKAFKSLPPENNPNDLDGVTEAGGALANTYVGFVNGGKVKALNLRNLSASK